MRKNRGLLMNKYSWKAFLLCFLLINCIYYIPKNMSENTCVLEVRMENKSEIELYYSSGIESFSDEQMVLGEWSQDGRKARFLLPNNDIQVVRIDFSNEVNDVHLKCINILNNAFWIKKINADKIEECIKEISNISEISKIDEELHFTTLGRDGYIIISDFGNVYTVVPRIKVVFEEIILFIVAWLLVNIKRIFFYIKNGTKVIIHCFLKILVRWVTFIKKLLIREEVIYTLLVIFIFSFIYLPILFNNNMYMYIDAGADTYCGGWPSITYARYLLSDMKLYDMSLGIGDSTFPIISSQLLNPFNWSALLFDEYYTSVGLYISLVLKNIVLAYYSYQYVKVKNINGVARIASSLIIDFSGWVIGWGQFYNFGAIYVFFVIALYGFEVWLKKSSYIVFIFSLCLLAITSPYFCYMALIFFAIYYILYIAKRDNWKKENINSTLKHGMKTLGLVLLSLGISAIIFIPEINELLKSPRVNGNKVPTFALGSAKLYLSMLFRMFSNNILGINDFIGVERWYECPFMFTGILSIFCSAIFVLDRSNWKKNGKYIFLILFSAIFIDFSSVIFNGFSTISYRWTFIFVPIFVLAIGNSLSRLTESKNKVISLFITLLFDVVFCGYGFWLKVHHPAKAVIWTSLYLILFFLNLYILCIWFIKNIKAQQFILVGILAVELAINGYYSVNRSGILSNEYKETSSYFDDSIIAIDYLNKLDDSFYRISKKYASIDLNDSLIQHYTGERRYASPLPGILWEFISFFDLRVPQSNYFYGFDDKQALRNISAGKYRFTMSDEKYFGYEKIAECGKVKIHENTNSFTFGTLYDNYIVENEMRELDSYERQDVLYSTVILEENIKENISKLSLNEVKKGLTSLKLVDTLTMETEDALEIDIVPNKEPLIIRLTGENATGAIILYTDTGEVIDENKISFSRINGEKIYYVDTLNIHSISIQKQTGNIESISIEKVDGMELTRKCMERKEQTLFIDYFSDTLIKSSCQNEVDKLLLLPILYDENWRVTVNGEKKELYKADGGYTAICLSAGKNDIEIRYVSNSFYLGALITLGSMCILLLIIYYTRKKTPKYCI